jgi:hypothetical protein
MKSGHTSEDPEQDWRQGEQTRPALPAFPQQTQQFRGAQIGFVGRVVDIPPRGFVPEAGGSPTNTALTYVWNGTDTETPVYELEVPDIQGTTEVVSVVADCFCS